MDQYKGRQNVGKSKCMDKYKILSPEENISPEENLKISSKDNNLKHIQ